MKPDKEEAGELTLDELEKVIGGQSYERYEQYRIEIINEYQGQKRNKTLEDRVKE
jgi:hypothetical protein